MKMQTKKLSSQQQQMYDAGRKCALEYSHRRDAGQVFDDMPISALDKNSKPTTERAKMLMKIWDDGFNSVKHN
jgi:hypothetical protein